MKHYWVRFSNGKGCIDAKNESEALGLARKLDSNPEIIGELPYPAQPRIVRQSEIPSLCFRPDECAGHTACPHRMSCSE